MRFFAKATFHQINYAAAFIACLYEILSILLMKKKKKINTGKRYRTLGYENISYVPNKPNIFTSIFHTTYNLFKNVLCR